jgi:hypothetical protein
MFDVEITLPCKSEFVGCAIQSPFMWQLIASSVGVDITALTRQSFNTPIGLPFMTDQPFRPPIKA